MITESTLRSAICTRTFEPICNDPTTEATHQEGQDITWYLGSLADGRWWTYDDAEPGPAGLDHLAIFDTEAAARQADAAGWAARVAEEAAHQTHYADES